MTKYFPNMLDASFSKLGLISHSSGLEILRLCLRDLRAFIKLKCFIKFLLTMLYFDFNC